MFEPPQWGSSNSCKGCKCRIEEEEEVMREVQKHDIFVPAELTVTGDGKMKFGVEVNAEHM